MSNPFARGTIALPIRPSPISPKRRTGHIRAQKLQRPPALPCRVRTNRSPSATRRAAAINSAHAMSAVVSVNTPGVLVTGILRRVAASTSILLNPTAKFATTFKLGFASKISSSIVSVSKHSSPSTPSNSGDDFVFVQIAIFGVHGQQRMLVQHRHAFRRQARVSERSLVCRAYHISMAVRTCLEM